MAAVHKRKEGFLSALREHGSVSEAARASGLQRRQAYRLRQQDPAFAAAWEQALSPESESGGQESPRWGAQVLALMEQGRSYERAVELVTKRGIAEAKHEAETMRAFVEDMARGCA